MYWISPSHSFKTYEEILRICANHCSSSGHAPPSSRPLFRFSAKLKPHFWSFRMSKQCESSMTKHLRHRYSLLNDNQDRAGRAFIQTRTARSATTKLHRVKSQMHPFLLCHNEPLNDALACVLHLHVQLVLTFGCSDGRTPFDVRIFRLDASMQMQKRKIKTI